MACEKQIMPFSYAITHPGILALEKLQHPHF